MTSSIPFQFTRSKYLLDIRLLVVSKRLVCVSPIGFLTTFESKP